jgi:hypothetical protein
MSLPHISGMWENFNEGEIIFNQVILNFFCTLYLFFFVILKAMEVLSLLLAKQKEKQILSLHYMHIADKAFWLPGAFAHFF